MRAWGRTPASAHCSEPLQPRRRGELALDGVAPRAEVGLRVGVGEGVFLGEEDFQPGRGAAEVAGDAEEVAGLRAAPVHDVVLGRFADDRHGEEQPLRRRHVAADDGEAVLPARLGHPFVERLGALDRHVVRQPERDRRVARRRVHRHHVADVDGDRFVAERAERRERPVEVDTLDERIARDDVDPAVADVVDRRVVADPFEEGVGRGVAERVAEPVDEAELADVRDGGERLVHSQGRARVPRRVGRDAPVTLGRFVGTPLRNSWASTAKQSASLASGATP